ncbi:MAG: hypothetical protein COA93_09320 [Alphaproteobacteria bacterium]|nr:MAG: hypothetical protein COA93_09320 [Alphaproteobacteria bacterium]
MIKNFFLHLILSSILVIGISFPSYAFSDLYIQNKSLNAGFYLRVPFGPAKKNEDKLKYGLRLNMTQQFNGGSQWDNNYRLSNRQMLNADLLSLNFSESGFRNLSLVGQKTFVYQNGLLRMNYAEGKKGGTHPAIWALAGVGVLFVGATAIYAITKDDDNGFRQVPQ